jgi:hypothetical protein
MDHQRLINSRGVNNLTAPSHQPQLPSISSPPQLNSPVEVANLSNLSLDGNRSSSPKASSLAAINRPGTPIPANKQARRLHSSNGFLFARPGTPIPSFQSTIAQARHMASINEPKVSKSLPCIKNARNQSRRRFAHKLSCSKKRALLIGASSKVKEFLAARGFQEEEMRILTDEPESLDIVSRLIPTRREIIYGVQWLVSGAKDGDSLFFYYGKRQEIAMVFGFLGSYCPGSCCYPTT